MSATGETPIEDIATVLSEIRAVAAELVELRADVKLATQHVGDVDKLTADIERIDAHLVKLDAFIYGDPPLLDRLERLEKKQEEDDQARQDEDAATRKGAGVAGDPAHREMARDEAIPLIAESEARTGKELRTLGEIVTAQGKRIEKLVDVALENRWWTAGGFLVLAALFYVLVQVVPW